MDLFRGDTLGGDAIAAWPVVDITFAHKMPTAHGPPRAPGEPWSYLKMPMVRRPRNLQGRANPRQE